jgi:N-acetyl-anhydromuramyl-L-alanine amidase AmpD
LRAALVCLPLVLAAVFLATCSRSQRAAPPPPLPLLGDFLERRGDEIVIAGHYVHTGAPVVLWTDPGGYDAYRTERRFSRREEMEWSSSQTSLATPARYGIRAAGLSDHAFEQVRGGGWSLRDLQERVDQFVLHYDVAGTSRDCFRILHDIRGLSVHFMLDIDGTIYQTLDVKERAWHAGPANDRSVGIEIANIGAYPTIENSPLAQWYANDPEEGYRLMLPPTKGTGGVRTPGFVGKPERLVVGEIQGQQLTMFDLTPEQYDSLIRLTAALSVALPKIQLVYPQNERGGVISRTLTPEQYASFQGVLGHWHITDNKIDPGPALDWERVVGGARELIRGRLNAHNSR